MKRVRIGYVGCGGLAQRVHIPNLIAASEHCSLDAIAEIRPRLARTVAEHWRIPRVYASHRELAADRDIDAVVVSGHWSTQGDIASDLLAAGKDVLMEKPMAASVEKAERILATERSSGRRLMVAYMKRYDAGNVLLKSTIDRCRSEGSFGRLRYVRNQGILGDWTAGLQGPLFTTDEPYPQPAEHWPRWLPASHRGGYFAFVQQYAHNINFLRWMLEPSSGGTEVRSVVLDPGDGMSGVTVFDIGGTLACMESGSVRCHEWNERTSFFFENGIVESTMFTLLLRNVPSTVEIYAKDPHRDAASRTALFPADGRTWAYRTEIDHFIGCVASGAPFRSSGQDALEDVRILERIYRAHVDTAHRKVAA